MLDSAIATPADDNIGTLERLPLHRVAPDLNQPRKAFDDAALQELADSIRTLGVLQPITVRPKLMGEVGEGDYDFTIVAGERRWRAAKLAGMGDIPAIIRADLATNPGAVAVLQLVENLQRADLTLWETATGCRALVDAIGLEAAAQKLGYSKPWVSQRANVCELPEEIRDLIERGLLTDVETAHNLVSLANLDEQGADTVDGWLEDITNGLPPTREDVRRELREAREQHEATAARERARQQRADQEAEARAAAQAKRDPLDLTPPDEDDEQDDGLGPVANSTTKASTTRTESSHERERRLREEAWTELMPDCRKLARESRKAILTALDESVPADHRSKEFSITVSQPMTHDECPAKATGARYHLDVRGSTADAGLIVEALDPKHKVGLSTRVTIAQLRQIEALLGEFFPVRTTADYGGAGTMPLRGVQLSNADALIRKTAAARQQAEQADQAQRRRVEALLAADTGATTPAPAAKSATKPTKTGKATATAQDGDGKADIAAFLKACTQRDAKARTKANDLHAAYVSWAGRHGRTVINITDHRWGHAIEAAGIEKKRSNGFVYIGLKLLIEGDEA